MTEKLHLENGWLDRNVSNAVATQKRIDAAMTDIDTSPEAVIGMANAMTGLGNHRCAALLRQIAKERDEARAEWQPRDTAPKDGSMFLAYEPQIKCCPYAVVRWETAWVENACFVYAETLIESSSNGPEGFTHWVHLPPPPK